MTDQERKAMEMALDALEDSMYPQKKQFDAIVGLKQALNVDAIDISATCVDETEKREHEPVAWYYADSDVEIHSVALSEDLDDDEKANCIPLYTAPPKREWVSLTDEKIEHEWVKWKASVPRYYGFAKGIEAALRSKNT